MQKIVLLVEHNRDDEELVMLAIKRRNVATKVVVVRDGAEALDYFFATGAYASRNSAETPQLVLLDLRLPKINGLEVLRRLRADSRTRRVPVVFLTSSNEEEHLLQGYELGTNSFIRKPVDFDRFVEVVDHLQRYWLMLNEPPPAYR